MPPLTKAQQKDSDERVEEFSKRYAANVEELQVDFSSFPQYVQIGPNLFGTLSSAKLVDKKYAPIPSPLTPNEATQG